MSNIRTFEGNLFEQFILEQTKMTLQDRERDGELAHLYVLELNDKDIVQSERASEDCRSLGIQIRKFKETLEENMQNQLFMFVSLGEAVNRFVEYLAFKYPGKRAAEWESKLTDAEYRRDVEALFASRIYEHKYRLSMLGIPAFASPEAKNQVYQIYLKKRIRANMHEAIGRFGKVAKLNPELAQLPKWVYDVFNGIITDLFLNDHTIYQLVLTNPQYRGLDYDPTDH